MPRRRKTKTAPIATEGLLLAPMVALMRTPLLANEARYPGTGAAESMAAIGEKIAATAEGILAAQMSLLVSFAQFWPEVLAGKTPSLLSGSAIERSIKASLVPTRRRGKANFQRLSKLC